MGTTLPELATVIGRAVALASVLSFAPAAAAQDGTDERDETWPEIQLLVRTSPKTRLFFLANVSQERESRADREGQVGIHADYLASEHAWFRVGYRYGRSLNSDDDFREHRIVVEQTFKTTLPGKVVASDRNRQDFRFVRGDYSFRYRNRLTLEREVAAGAYRFTPYVQGEIYFDSRFRTWNRHRYGGGVALPFSKPAGPAEQGRLSIRNHMTLDLSYTRQNDSRSSPHHVNALGASLIFSF